MWQFESIIIATHHNPSWLLYIATLEGMYNVAKPHHVCSAGSSDTTLAKLQECEVSSRLQCCYLHHTLAKPQECAPSSRLQCCNLHCALVNLQVFKQSAGSMARIHTTYCCPHYSGLWHSGREWKNLVVGCHVHGPGLYITGHAQLLWVCALR